MASTSTSFVQRTFKYDVFLSFRGKDTRKSFVDHLYHALEQKGIETYKDDEKIRKGKTISDELIEAIEDSQFYIIVFSKNYASSSWCLEELVKIMECDKMTEHTAYPVFYDVEPTEVRKLYGPVGEAFKKHEKEEAAGKWRAALKEAGALAGWELKTTVDGHEANFIQKIIQEISLELRFINSSVDGNLVGMETRVNEVISSLEMGVNDVRMIGIKGMGGAGKTTLARAVFDTISFQFEGQSFVENIREESKPSLSGLKSLQKQVLSDVLNDQGITVSSVHEGKKMIKKKMHVRKVLIVLDDVDKIDQLEALVGDRDWFKPGSRIIITTRDEQVLIAHKVCLIQNVNLLSTEEAVCLFSRYAFGKEVPVPGYGALSGQVVCYAAGLPLTIRVLGSFLCGKNDLDWEDAIERLKTIPLKETLDILELSYMGLEEDYKEIFLDVACILKGWRKDDAVIALQSCGFHARNGLRVLEQKSLIQISKYGILDMHDHIQELGRHIVRRLHPDEPWRHSRLWIDEEIEDILANDLSTEETKCIKLRTEDLYMKGLANLKKLRFLTVYSLNNELSGSEDDCYDSDQELDEVSQYLPNSLRFLRWSGYPFRSFPKTFQARNLVGLELHDSNIVQLWKGGEETVLYKLRFLDIFDLKVRTLDLRLTPNLEKLRIIACEDLVELRMPTESLKLRSINLTLTPNLDKLCLVNCHDLVELLMPTESQNLRTLKLNHAKVKTLRLGITPNLVELILEDCNELVELHMPAESLKLRFLKFSHSKLRILKLGITPNLAELILEDCNDMVELHMPTKILKLRSLKLSHSKLRVLNLGITPNLEELILEDCNDMVELHMLAKSVNVRSLKLSHSKLRILDLGVTSNLVKLILEDCKYFVEIHMPAESLYLESFKISHSNLRILNLRSTPDLAELVLKDCNDLVKLKVPTSSKLVSLDLSYTVLRNIDLMTITPVLKTLSLKDCPDLIDPLPSECQQLISLSHSKLRTLHLGNTRNLVDVSINGCYDLVELYMPAEYHNLVCLTISHSMLRKLHLGITPDLKSLTLVSCLHLVELRMPYECRKLISLELSFLKLKTLDLGLSRTLEMLSLKCCDELVELHMPSECLNLRCLKLSDLKLKTLDLRVTPNLEMLSLSDCRDLAELHMPTECLNLRSLELRLKLTTFPFGRTPNLVELILSANHLTFLPDSIWMLKHLKSLKIQLSYHVERLPEDIGRLECLEELYLSSLSIKNLPDSICMLKHLQSLEIRCFLLEKLPEDIGKLECLEKLKVSKCSLLQNIPNSICEMKRLKYLDLSRCYRVKKLPAEIGCLECLKELNINYAGINHLPHSIFQLKGLCIIGSRKILEACGITSEIETFYDGFGIERYSHSVLC